MSEGERASEGSRMKIDGIPVRDADRVIILHISEQDARGRSKDPRNCAAAKAACRVDGVKEARVYRSRTFLLIERANGMPCWVRLHTPERLQKEIVAFDRGGKFEPGDYVLRPMPPAGRLGADQRIRPSKQNGGSKKRRPHRLGGIREVAPVDREAGKKK
jgi:hypothetical protein